MVSEVKKTPWRNGIWYNENHKCFLTYIEGEKMEMKNMICLDYPEFKSALTGILTFGDFGPAAPEIVEATGIKNYNFETKLEYFGKIPGVINEEGTQMHKKGLVPNQFEVSNWLSQEDLEKLKEDREPYEEPISPYKPQPDKLGKMLWFSGTLYSTCLIKK